MKQNELLLTFYLVNFIFLFSYVLSFKFVYSVSIQFYGTAMIIKSRLQANVAIVKWSRTINHHNWSPKSWYFDKILKVVI